MSHVQSGFARSIKAAAKYKPVTHGFDQDEAEAEMVINIELFVFIPK